MSNLAQKLNLSKEFSIQLTIGKADFIKNLQKVTSEKQGFLSRLLDMSSIFLGKVEADYIQLKFNEFKKNNFSHSIFLSAYVDGNNRQTTIDGHVEIKKSTLIGLITGILFFVISAFVIWMKTSENIILLVIGGQMMFVFLIIYFSIKQSLKNTHQRFVNQLKMLEENSNS